MQIHCKHDELINPSKLKNHPKNRNKHGQDQIERLAELYKYHGIRHPIIVSNLSNCIVAGHGRKLAAIRAGIKEMPVVFQDFESLDQEYAFIQSDNAIALWAELDMAGINSDIGDLGPDFDINMLGIQDFTLDVAEKDFEGDPDEVPEVVEPVAKLGQIYKLGEHRLMCGDSNDQAAINDLMDGQKAQAMITDPPYGIDYQSNYRKEKFEVLKNDDVVMSDWVTAAQSYVEGWVLFFIGWQRMSEWLEVGKPLGDLTNIIIWKKHAAMGDLKGSFSPNYELALAYNRGAKLSGDKRPSAIIETNIDSAESFVHPTQKPIKLFDYLFNAIPSKTVLDLFGGSGSTLIACEKTNRKCFMMELDCFYISVIIERWQKFTGKEAYLLNNDGTETPYNELKNG